MSHFPFSRSLALVLSLGALALATESAHAQPPSKARRWKVMVIVPEQHLQERRIPDPAVETELCRQFIDAGYKVVDQDRIADLRYSAVMDRILEGGPNATKEVMQLRRRFGADILISGEAFTQEVMRKTVDTDMGDMLQIRCRSRVELKAIRMDTGERIYTDALQKTGSPEPTVELSSKACLEETAQEMGPGVLAKLDHLAYGSTQSIELELHNIGSLTLASQLETLLGHIPGVKDVTPGDFDASTYFAEVTLTRISLRAFAARLESDPHLRRFRLKVQSANGSKIIAVRR